MREQRTKKEKVNFYKVRDLDKTTKKTLNDLLLAEVRVLGKEPRKNKTKHQNIE